MFKLLTKLIHCIYITIWHNTHNMEGHLKKHEAKLGFSLDYIGQIVVTLSNALLLVEGLLIEDWPEPRPLDMRVELSAQVSLAPELPTSCCPWVQGIMSQDRLGFGNFANFSSTEQKSKEKEWISIFFFHFYGLKESFPSFSEKN